MASKGDENKRMVDGENQPGDDGALDRALRPQRLDELIGQDSVRDNLRVMITAARARGEALDHVLIHGPPGLGKCIAPNSLVLTAHGLCRIGDLAPAELKAETAAELTNQHVYGRHGVELASHIFNGGVRPTVRTATQSGFEIEGTLVHPVLVATDAGAMWMPLAALKPGDFVAVARNTQLWGEPQPIAFQPKMLANSVRKAMVDIRIHRLNSQRESVLQRSRTTRELTYAYNGQDKTAVTVYYSAKRSRLPVSDGRIIGRQQRFLAADLGADLPVWCCPDVLNADLAYVMGLLVGDGHFEKAMQWPACNITSSEPETHARVQQICQEQFGWKPRVGTYGSRSTRISFSQNFGHFMLYLGMGDGLAGEKFVPDAVMRSPADVVRGFLQGLFDADGHAWRDGYLEYVTKSRRLAVEVQLLLANFGIIAHCRKKAVASETYWQLLIGEDDARLFGERIGFRLARKQSRLELSRGKPGASRSARAPGSAVLLSALLDATAPHSRSVHKRFDHAKRGDRVMSMAQARALIKLLPPNAITLPEYSQLMSLLDDGIYWDKVVRLDAGHSQVYDLCVPGTHAFVANGVVNHNTTLAHITGNEMGSAVRVTSGPAIERAGDLAAILTNLRASDILFIDEIHRLNRAVEEILYPAMEDSALDIIVGKGPSARSVRLKLPPITVIGATTRLALMTAPLRARFGAQLRVDFYPVEAIEKIVVRAAHLLNTPIDEDAKHEVATRARGTPRVALRLLKRVRDYAQVKGDGRVTRQLAIDGLNLLEVDPLGLDDIDRRVLRAIIDKFNGGPVGLETIAASISEESDTIMDVVEPYLLQLGFIDRTPRGRVATARAYDHLGIFYNGPQQGQLGL